MVWVPPAAQQVSVNATLVIPILGWPLNNRKGILVTSLLGTIRLLSASWLTGRGVPVSNIDKEPLILCIRCPSLTNELDIRRHMVCTRMIVVLAATLVIPTVLTVCIPLPQTLIAPEATLIRWLNTNRAKQVPVTLLTSRECTVRRAHRSRKQVVPRLWSVPNSPLNKLIL